MQKLGYGAPKQKIPTFRHINALQRCIPWAIFTKFSLFMGNFMFGHVLQFGGFAQGISELLRFMFRECERITPHFSAPSGETMHRMRIRFRGARIVRTTSITCQAWCGSDIAHRREAKQFDVFYCCFCLFLPVILLNDKVCERHFATVGIR